MTCCLLMTKTNEGSDGGDDQEFVFGHVKWDMPIEHPSENECQVK